MNHSGAPARTLLGIVAVAALLAWPALAQQNPEDFIEEITEDPEPEASDTPDKPDPEPQPEPEVAEDPPPSDEAQTICDKVDTRLRP